MSESITSTTNSQSEAGFKNKLLASMLENERKKVCGLIGTTDDNTCPGNFNCPYQEDLNPEGSKPERAMIHCLLKRCSSIMEEGYPA